MWSEKKILEYLKRNLTEKRFSHVLNVCETSEKLAKLYGADVEKAKISALIHDCAKNFKEDYLIDLLQKANVTIDEITIRNFELLHGHAAAVIGKNEMEIYDEEILMAAKYHTTGRENMSLLEKIIYLADYIEPGRVFDGVDLLRKVAFNKSLDEALLIAIDNTIKYILSKGQLIHIDTIKARNYLLINCK